MKITVVGCSPAWPNPGGAQSGYLVNGSANLLLDCGPGVLARLRVRDGWPEVDAIAITHFHLDHWGDLVPWVWGALYLHERGDDVRRPDLWVPPHGAELLAEFGSRLGFPEMFERVFDLHEYVDGEPFDVDGQRITPARVPHYTLDSYALRISDGERTIVYSGDCAPTERLPELARGADLFICEATLLHGDLDHGPPRGHLSLDEALAAFEASGAKRLLVTHRPTELPSDGGLEYAYDGLEVDV